MWPFKKTVKEEWTSLVHQESQRYDNFKRECDSVLIPNPQNPKIYNDLYMGRLIKCQDGFPVFGPTPPQQMTNDDIFWPPHKRKMTDGDLYG